MINICPNCNKVLEEGDRVRATVSSTYHFLKSAVAYALDKNDIEVLELLKHVDCNFPKGVQGD